MNIFTYALKIWLIILPVAFINGTIRVTLMNPYISEKAGHIISTLMLSAAIVFIVYFFLKKSKVEHTKKNLLILGLLLVVATTLFEFGLGRLTGKSWESLLADYDVFNGKIWPLVLLTELFAPMMAKHRIDRKTL